MRVALIMALLLFPFMTGCTEEEKAEAKELWLGIPNKTPPKDNLLASDTEDSEIIETYKEKARIARKSVYDKMSNRKAMQLFSEKADALDVDNMRDLMASISRSRNIDNNFTERQELHTPRPERRYTHMDFQQGQYGDMYRLGGAMQDFSNEMMRQAAIKAERAAIQEARSALHAYTLHMEKTKLSLLKQKKSV